MGKRKLGADSKLTKEQKNRRNRRKRGKIDTTKRTITTKY